MSKTNIYNKVAKNIKKIRTGNNITQESLAYNAGLNRAYIGYIERGERKPSLETLEKIARSLEVEIHVLFVF